MEEEEEDKDEDGKGKDPEKEVGTMSEADQCTYLLLCRRRPTLILFYGGSGLWQWSRRTPRRKSSCLR